MNVHSTVRSFKELRLFKETFPKRKSNNLSNLKNNLVIFNNIQSEVIVLTNLQVHTLISFTSLNQGYNT